jgi:2-polyprenyl-3-methyl-5-hydroxy-6-metoxy-1,4-benzoquinol methylase
MLLIAQPKSASTSLAMTIAKIGKKHCNLGIPGDKIKEKCPGFYNIQKYHINMVERSPLFLKQVIKGPKTIFKEHILPTEEHLKSISKHNDPIVVLLRNPNDSNNSYERINIKDVYPDLKDFYDKWLSFSIGKSNILVIFYEDLILNYEKTIKKILNHYRISFKNILPLEKLKYTKVGEDRLKSLDSEKLKDLYDSYYFLNKVEGWQEFKKGEINERRKEILEKINVKNKTVLDVGFGRGELLQLAHEKGAKKCIGLDYSKDAYEIAKDYCDKSIELYNYKISELDMIYDKKFNIVFMIDIIEHLTELEFYNFLDLLMPKLNSNSKLVISTPVNIARGNYRNMHITQYTDSTLAIKLNNYFKSIKINTSSKGQYFVVCTKKKTAELDNEKQL